MSRLTAAFTGAAMPLPLGRANPYGATSKAWPLFMKTPFDVATMYAATWESANPTWARPLETARFASTLVAVGEDRDGLTSRAFVQVLAWVWASVCSVVPSSTATVWPQSEARPLKLGLPVFT